MIKQEMNKWIEALRSGDYLQVQGTLKGLTEDGEEGYCCLGVFESIQGREPEVEVEDESGHLQEGNPETYHSIEGILGEGLQGKLIKMNDCGRSFTDIADYIEKQLPLDKD